MNMGKIGYAARLAVHGVQGHPRSSVMVVVVMALGLAACMTVLTVFHTLGSDPLHGRGAATETLLLRTSSAAPDPGQALLKVDAARQIVEQAGTLPIMAALGGTDDIAAGENNKAGDSSASVLYATSRVGSIFGIPLQKGHWWTARQDREQAPVAVVSGKVAEKLFGTTNVLGKTIVVGGEHLTIIGVRGNWQPRLQFYAQGATVFNHSTAQVLMPLSVAATAGLSLTAWSGCKDGFMAGPWKKCDVVQLWGYRLHAAQRTQLVHLARRFVASGPDAESFQPVFLDVPGWLQLQHVLPDSVRVYAWVAMAFLALCLFNAAGVLAARFMRRRSEVGVRRALGASRREVFAQHLFESGALAVLGGLLALPLVYGALALVHAQTLSYGAVIHFDAGTFLGLCVVTVVTGLLVGIYPAWRASTRPPALQIKQN